MEAELRLKPQGPVLSEYNLNRDRVCFIMGPLGSGKTIQSCLNVLERMCEQEPNRDNIRKSRWVAVRNTYPDLMSTTVKDWLELVDEMGLGKLNREFPPTYYMDFDLPDGSRVKAELVFMALDRPDAVRKLRGMQVTGFWLNEVKELQKEIVDMAGGRIGRYPSAVDGGPSWFGIIGDTNSPDQDSWYYELAEEEKPEGWTFLRQPGGVIKNKLGKWEENPNAENIHNLPKRYYIDQVAAKTQDWINVNLANNYGTVVTGSPIYKDQFNELFHLAGRDEKYVAIKKLPIVIGFDFGLTPAACIGQLTSTGQLRILREIVSTHYGLRGFLDDVVLPVLAQEFPHHPVDKIEVWFDPSGVRGSESSDESCSSILLETGFIARPAPSNDPMQRWEAVRWFLSRFAGRVPAFVMNDDCQTLRKGFVSSYAFRRLQVSGETRYENKADKNFYSHVHDAIQYLCLGIKGLTIEDEAPRLPSLPAADDLTAY